jgi:integrase
VTETKDTQNEPLRKRDQHLPKDGQWRSFPKVPHLLQYISNDNYYARIKVKGKVIRESLKTGMWTTAKLRLTDFLKKHQEARRHLPPPMFMEEVDLFKRDLEQDATIKPQSKGYRLWCLRKIELSWPELWKLRFDERSPARSARSGRQSSAAKLPAITTTTRSRRFGKYSKRARVKQKNLHLPEPSQFKELAANLRKHSGGWGRRVGDLVEFLSCGGKRINSEALMVAWEDIDWQRKQFIVGGDPETWTKNSETRRVPIIPDMEALLNRLKDHLGGVPAGRILRANRCNESSARACNEIGIPRITHHDLHHLFATRCIESGVDIPTVSRWLGHKDGEALAMRTYGHLRNEHSQAMAQKVKS